MKVLPHLFESNREWATEMLRKDPEYFSKLCDIHDPDYLWIGCSDSRVPANTIVGIAPGELFVHRNVGNVLPMSDINAMSVIDYAVNVLGVKHIVVCGHYRCGGVRAALEGSGNGVVALWLQHIRLIAEANIEELNAIASFEQRWNRLCELNVVAQVRTLSAGDIVRSAWARGSALSVHGWIYDLRDGLLRDLDVTADRAEER